MNHSTRLKIRISCCQRGNIETPLRKKRFTLDERRARDKITSQSLNADPLLLYSYIVGQEKPRKTLRGRLWKVSFAGAARAPGPYSPRYTITCNAHTHREIIFSNVEQPERKEGHWAAGQWGVQKCSPTMNASATQATLFRARTMAVIGNHQWLAEKDRARTCTPLSNDHQSNANCSLPTACGFSLSLRWTPLHRRSASTQLTYAGEEGNLVNTWGEPRASADAVRVISAFLHARKAAGKINLLEAYVCSGNLNRSDRIFYFTL